MDVTFADGAERRVFREPLDVVVVRDPAETVPAFARLDEALMNGYAIAGYLAYELGCAWNGTEARPSEDALLRVGIYERASLERAPDLAELAEAAPGPLLSPSVAGVSGSAYARALGAIAERLHAGDVYQVNYTVPFRSRTDAEPRRVFDALAAVARVPYAALVETADRAYVSLSPELFLAIDGDVVRTRPMKGTASPGDETSLASAKNRAEHVMIVDLLRNDLHRVCRDVRVEAFETIERYPTFVTMTSTIAGRLREGTGLEALFAATFPCGSVTGAPKRSAMRRIFELETTPRGIAMGSIGFVEPASAGRPRRGWWNVAIRTLAFDRRSGVVDSRVGGGIVADSTPGAEWQEIAVKRRLFRTFEAPVGLIETLLVRNGAAGVEPHVVRLRASAWRLGIDLDEVELRERIATAARGIVGEALLRVHLAAGGDVTVASRPFEPTPLEPRMCLAPQRLDARDPLLRYKTDRRSIYDDALAFARTHDCFEAVLLNRDGDVADGAHTSVFVEEPGGRLATPRLDDGALDGLGRRALITSGRAYERRIDEHELADRAIHLGSRTRGLVRAAFIEAAVRHCR